jgi:hypothetical protein
LHTEELYNLYSSPNIIKVTESRRMRRVIYVAEMGDEKCIRKSERLKGRGIPYAEDA